MKRIACLIMTAALLSNGLFAQNNTLSDAEKNSGWQLLFDGTSTKGWHLYGKSGTSTSPWTVADGALHMDASNKSAAGDLVTDNEYTNFDFKLEWKISKNGNSGIMICVKEDPQYKEPYFTGPEIQVLDNDGHPDGKIKKHRAADLYDLISSTSEPVKAVGEWHQVEIKLNQGKLDIFLNGVQINSTTMWDDHWWSLVKGSKFKDMPGFSKSKTGKLDLQDHGNDVWFRNIKIKILD